MNRSWWIGPVFILLSATTPGCSTSGGAVPATHASSSSTLSTAAGRRLYVSRVRPLGQGGEGEIAVFDAPYDLGSQPAAVIRLAKDRHDCRFPAPSHFAVDSDGRVAATIVCVGEGGVQRQELAITKAGIARGEVGAFTVIDSSPASTLGLGVPDSVDGFQSLDVPMAFDGRHDLWLADNVTLGELGYQSALTPTTSLFELRSPQTTTSTVAETNVFGLGLNDSVLSLHFDALGNLFVGANAAGSPALLIYAAPYTGVPLAANVSTTTFKSASNIAVSPLDGTVYDAGSTGGKNINVFTGVPLLALPTAPNGGGGPSTVVPVQPPPPPPPLLVPAFGLAAPSPLNVLGSVVTMATDDLGDLIAVTRTSGNSVYGGPDLYAVDRFTVPISVTSPAIVRACSSGSDLAAVVCNSPIAHLEMGP